MKLEPKTSSPFLRPKQIDLGVVLDQQFVAQARATQEYRTIQRMIDGGQG